MTLVSHIIMIWHHLSIQKSEPKDDPPAAARYKATGHPSPPAPTTKTLPGTAMDSLLFLAEAL